MLGCCLSWPQTCPGHQGHQRPTSTVLPVQQARREWWRCWQQSHPAAGHPEAALCEGGALTATVLPCSRQGMNGGGEVLAAKPFSSRAFRHRGYVWEGPYEEGLLGIDRLLLLNKLPQLMLLCVMVGSHIRQD
eukprot:1150935-Pelagomonas_calceolata.AAC.17